MSKPPAPQIAANSVLTKDCVRSQSLRLKAYKLESTINSVPLTGVRGMSVKQRKLTDLFCKNDCSQCFAD